MTSAPNIRSSEQPLLGSGSTQPAATATVTRAAGALLWRGSGDQLEVALVHRPKYDDWSWPKGKLDPGESWPAAAVREVHEETGIQVTLGVPLTQATYEVGTNGGVRQKLVHYWAAQVPSGAPMGLLNQEVDDIQWLPPRQARRRLDYRRDRAQLADLVAFDQAGHLDTWPLILVRHGSAVARRHWADDDTTRPLSKAGQLRARTLVPVLAAYGVRRVLTSSSDRCIATVLPYASLIDCRPTMKHSLSEEGYAADPARVITLLDKTASAAKPALLCSHRPVLPAMLVWLAQRAGSPEVAQALQESTGPGLVKGEALVAHLRGTGKKALVVAVERHLG